ncbi:MAG: precorrin-6A reductase [Termitinemataceae bacterium]|nr:MAG: precorrin-6A reductase [Termitinemataceae bacterium]
MDVIIFGGTTEGRELAQWCSINKIKALYCAATELGALDFPYITVRVGRLNTDAMSDMIESVHAKIIVDASHPYASVVSMNIASASLKTNTPLIRLHREQSDTGNALIFYDTQNLISYLSKNDDIVFITTGAKEAEIFTQVPDFKQRFFFRLLPSLEGLQNCLYLGYPEKHLIMMCGPFSRELNSAMFKAAGASILVTKESGVYGGFAEKLQAADDCGMQTAVIARPPENSIKLWTQKETEAAIKKILIIDF